MSFARKTIERCPWVVALLLLTATSGCHTARQSCPQCEIVSPELACRTGGGLGPHLCPGEFAWPPGVVPDDGLTETEAVVTALWNNAAFNEALAELGLTRAQLFDAGLLPDPQFVIFFPVGPKQLEFSTFQAVDALWLRPIRQRAAELDLQRVSRTMVQNGLNLIRDVRLAHADLVFAQSRAELAREAEKLQGEIAGFASKRFDAGDISELEVTTSNAQAVTAKADAARFEQDRVLARNRLAALLSLTVQGGEILAAGGSLRQLPDADVESLVSQALAMRPDLRAAQVAIQAAAEREELAEASFMLLDAVFDANSRGTEGFESGPGLRMTLPLWNRNRGGVQIASAQLQQMLRRYVTVRDQIALDVRTAVAQAKQAQDNLTIVQVELLPTLSKATEAARKSYTDGGTDYFFVLQTTNQFLNARTQELDQTLALRRSVAEVDRSVGYHVSSEWMPLDVPQPDAIELPEPSSALRKLPACRPVSWTNGE